MKTVLMSMFLSILINILYMAGVLTLAYVQTVRYQPDITEYENVHFLDSSVAFGYSGGFFSTFILMTIIGTFIVWCILKIVIKLRAE